MCHPGELEKCEESESLGEGARAESPLAPEVQKMEAV